MTGIYLDPVLAMANHSCMPSAFVSFDQRNAVLRAWRDIKEGDEITICYVGMCSSEWQPIK
jgi:Proteins containing SET domain